ncbi:STT3 subunit of oligosaccharyl transferase [Dictyostelium purpureum]|uniref:dolichyl-diphosphooligosaccharide--protein glycotransferase n=1 Tax=Dictyostelium purpureum TaxID=5786 RepID=F0ZGL1_DICPU|nr:STT3 subunit of oligosaccharyl transferase [Dictyostelium purpureum]EGC36923.1 STT3 subunit of oligosaccharyl transferase [Dictyostelium purpureum]|eukprot:XP_003286566.1 STT3 subunit of oligosaccharyl transferase [Dictyostelium purpureum]
MKKSEKSSTATVGASSNVQVEAIKETPNKDNQEFLIKVLILSVIYVLAFSTRLFSVLRYESVIHEFDPYFNYRSTIHLVKEGFYSFLNWFDERSWYPLGRIVGGTIYPGLMATASVVHWALNSLNLTVDIRNVCVLLSPWFASNTAMVTYKFAKEIRDTQTGLVAAAMIAIVPGYISRSVAGSFDNEGIAIFALIFTYYCWIKAVNTGSLMWAAICSLAYFYMASAWGGYVFIINLIPLHAFFLLLTGRYSHRLYIAYSTMFVMGTILSMQINFISFQPVQSSEHLAAIGIFGLLQLFAGLQWFKSHLTNEAFKKLQRFAILSVLSIAGAILVIGTATGYISPFNGRFYSLLDPTYARDNIPIIASVSEHQPTTWASYFFDLHILVFLFPAGLYFCFRKLTDSNIFLILYGVTSIYFSGVMVRLMLVLAPVACVLAAVAVSATLTTYMKKLKAPSSDQNNTKESGGVMVAVLTVLLILYAFHCTWVTSEAYSSPSIVLSAKQGDGSRVIFDDFREAYRWIGQNTADDARIMSWWDYGYQLSAMANRTILVDNNTWNNSHIAQVGKAFASSEEDAYYQMKALDVDYVLVIFGGLTGYSSDDINKFLWMVRIGGSCDPTLKEEDYLTDKQYRIDKGASPTMLNSLIYKLSYYRFSEVHTDYQRPAGFDRVRGVEIGYKGFDLTYLEEAFTSVHWLVRVYRVKDFENRA